MSAFSERRFGKFKISRDLLEDCGGEVMRIMGRMAIIQAGYDYLSDSFEYTAASELFCPMPPGIIDRYYDISVINGEVVAR